MGLFLYIVAQFISVIISTIKYVVTVKSSPRVAALVNASACTLSCVATKLLTEQPMYVIIIITLTSNLLGVPVGRWLVDKFTKDRLWVYNATIKTSDGVMRVLKSELKAHGIQSVYTVVIPNEMYTMEIFSCSKGDSRIIKNNLNAFRYCKYHVIESR